MKLRELKLQLENNQVDKQSYIRHAYEIHDILFDYADYLGTTNISSIRIEDGCVVFRFRDSGLELITARGDTRAAPLDTLNFSSYESNELQLHKLLIKPGSTVLDVGANIGWFALSIQRLVEDVSIHCFEPIPATFDLLEKNVALNDAQGIFLHPFGLSDQEGSAQFYVDPSLSVNASMRLLSGCADVELRDCKLSTVDLFVDDRIACVDFIKCDVEGAEFLVLKGALATLAKHKPVLYVEMLRKWAAPFGYHPNDLIHYLSGFGYSCFSPIGTGVRAVIGISDDTVETNFFFFHREKHAVIIEGLSA
jgi:FkbM family methyltransferase